MLGLIKKRRSIRKFDDMRVPEEMLFELIEAATFAPSGSNVQSWKFCIVNDNKTLNQIKVFSPGLLGNPPSLIVICSDKTLSLEKGGILGRDEMRIMDAAMAAQNIMLLATHKGLATCPVKGFNEQAVRKILNIPDSLSIDLIISVGYSSEQPSAPKRKSVKEVTFINQWGDKN
jgi:nitroreductase